MNFLVLPKPPPWWQWALAYLFGKRYQVVDRSRDGVVAMSVIRWRGKAFVTRIDRS